MEGRLPTTGQSPVELKRQLELERGGQPFLIHRNAAGEQLLTALPEDRRLRIGRTDSADVALTGDEQVSRLHAEIELAAGEWLLIDDGLSSNGSFVNGERVAGRRRLRDGDVLRLGATLLVFRNPAESAGGETAHAGDAPRRRDLTEMQRRVLEALCRPAHGGGFAHPASNQEIADELHLSVSAVKAHLRVLFEKFGVDELPQTHKRARLAELAVISGAVRHTDG